MSRILERHRTIVSLLTGTLVFATILTVSPQQAIADHTLSCRNITIVFARGSSQRVDESTEANAFLNGLFDRIADTQSLSPTLEVERYYLDQTSKHGWDEYSAVEADIRTLVSPDVTALGRETYRAYYNNSVEGGVNLLEMFLENRVAICPSELFVLAGYSQGAHVVGEALLSLSQKVKNQIVHVSLFGDPKLYLPEGRGLIPAGCRGEESPWRRGNVGCTTDNGIMGARNPYIPTDMEDRVGSWCDRNDHICNNNPFDSAWSAHDHYADPGGEIEEAVREATSKLSEFLKDYEFDSSIDFYRFKEEAIGEDVVILLDSSGSMSDEISQVKQLAHDIAVDIIATGGRIALTEYRDRNDAFVARILLPLTSELGAFERALNPVRAFGGDDSPEALLAALMRSFNELQWRTGSVKTAIVITDAGYHDPDLAEGWTYRDVIDRSREIDPINIFPIVPQGIGSHYEDIASGTAGDVILIEEGFATTIWDSLPTITTRPIVFFERDFYGSNVGETIRFEVNAADLNDDIVSYWWDLDANGTAEITTTDPFTNWTYSQPYSGLAEVRAVNREGAMGSAVASVKVSSDWSDREAPGPPVILSVDVSSSDISTQSIDIRWSAPVEGGLPAGYIVTLADDPFYFSVPSPNTRVVLSGIPRSVTSLSVRSVNEYGSSVPTIVNLERAPDDSGECPGPGVSSPFLDVPDAFFAADAITCIYSLGVTQGRTATEFAPDDVVNRAQMAAFMARLYSVIEGSPAPIVPTSFDDVPPELFAAADIARIFGLGVTQGRTATEFAPDDVVNRAQMAAFMARLYSVIEGSPAPIVPTSFDDVPPELFAAADIARIFGLGVTQGRTATEFAPDDVVNRAQMAAFMARLYRAMS